MFDASHDAGCQQTSLGRHKRPSRKGTTPQHTLDPKLYVRPGMQREKYLLEILTSTFFHLLPI